MKTHSWHAISCWKIECFLPKIESEPSLETRQGEEDRLGPQKMVQETWMGDGYVHYVDTDYRFMNTCILISKIIQKYTLNILTAFSYTSMKLLKQ